MGDLVQLIQALVAVALGLGVIAGHLVPGDPGQPLPELALQRSRPRRQRLPGAQPHAVCHVLPRRAVRHPGAHVAPHVVRAAGVELAKGIPVATPGQLRQHRLLLGPLWRPRAVGLSVVLPRQRPVSHRRPPGGRPGRSATRRLRWAPPQQARQVPWRLRGASGGESAARCAPGTPSIRRPWPCVPLPHPSGRGPACGGAARPCGPAPRMAPEVSSRSSPPACQMDAVRLGSSTGEPPRRGRVAARRPATLSPPLLHGHGRGAISRPSPVTSKSLDWCRRELGAVSKELVPSHDPTMRRTGRTSKQRAGTKWDVLAYH
jgi:hypothetical protein